MRDDQPGLFSNSFCSHPQTANLRRTSLPAGNTGRISTGYACFQRSRGNASGLRRTDCTLLLTVAAAPASIPVDTEIVRYWTNLSSEFTLPPKLFGRRSMIPNFSSNITLPNGSDLDAAVSGSLTKETIGRKTAGAYVERTTELFRAELSGQFNGSSFPQDGDAYLTGKS